MKTEEGTKLTIEEIEEYLPDGPVIHTFRIKDKMLLGADWTREMILERIRTHGVEIAMPNQKKANHGLASWDDDEGWLYIENRREPKP